MQAWTIPLAKWVDQGIDWLHLNLSPVFACIQLVVGSMETNLRHLLLPIPPLVIIVCAAAFAWWRVSLKLAFVIAGAFVMIWNLGLWKAAMETLALVIVASGISFVIGLPVGIWMHESKRARGVITPILDYMQTTPSFVYLIPTVLFFGMGSVPGIAATVMFAFPPPVRLTALGLDQVDKEVLEAGQAFGCSPVQLLWKIKLPLALPSILLGINQCVMMALSMVVIASMIGARGLGTLVIQSLSTVDISLGIESGVAVVLLAIILDRLSRGALRGRDGGGWL